jgi:hypothetical protein
MADMLVFMIVVIVLIGVAYADFCLIDNTAHFGICFGRVTAAEETRKEVEAATVVSPESSPAAAGMAAEVDVPCLPARPASERLIFLEMEPVLELSEAS